MDVLKQERLFQNRKMMFWNTKSGHFPVLDCPFPVFCVLLGKWFCPGASRDRGVCPGRFAPALVPGQRDTGTRKFFCPAGRPVPWKPYIQPFSLQTEKSFEGYPIKTTQIFLGCHLRFFRVAPTQIFFRVLTWFFSNLWVWHQLFSSCKPEKKLGRSYPKEISGGSKDFSAFRVALERLKSL